MKNSVAVIRAIGTEFAKRMYVPVAVIIAITDVVLLGLMVWLLTVSAWWLLLAVPVFVLVVVSIVLLVIAQLIIRTIAPVQTATQKTDVKAFVDKLQNLSEIVQTPKPILLFRIVRDVVAPKQGGFIQSTSSDTLSLKKDFQSLQRSFDQHIIEQ